MVTIEQGELHKSCSVMAEADSGMDCGDNYLLTQGPGLSMRSQGDHSVISLRRKVPPP